VKSQQTVVERVTDQGVPKTLARLVSFHAGNMPKNPRLENIGAVTMIFYEIPNADNPKLQIARSLVMRR
jgi:hypothetical protein